jgi:hypothetical protein
MLAAQLDVTCVVGAQLTVVAVRAYAAFARASSAGVGEGTSVPVVTGASVGRVQATEL